jgi:hypothetical protein
VGENNAQKIIQWFPDTTDRRLLHKTFLHKIIQADHYNHNITHDLQKHKYEVINYVCSMSLTPW